MLLTAVGTLVANLIADLLYGVLDPVLAGPQDEGDRDGGQRMSTIGADFMAEGTPDQPQAVEEAVDEISARSPGVLVQRHLE